MFVVVLYIQVLANFDSFNCSDYEFDHKNIKCAPVFMTIDQLSAH